MTDETVVQAKVEPVDQTAVQPAVKAEDEEPPPQMDWTDLFLTVLLGVSLGVLLVACLVIIATGSGEMIWAMVVGAFTVGLLWGLVTMGSSLLSCVNYNLRRKSRS